MRELIKKENDISLTVLNKNNEDGTLAQRAIFIMPYDTDSSFFPTFSGIHQMRIAVLYGGIFGILKVDKKGAYGSGYGICSRSIKDKRAFDSDELEKQIQGYLSVLRMTEGKPASVVVVANDKQRPLELVIPFVLEFYKDTFVSENEKLLAALEKEAEKSSKPYYNAFTAHGLRRRLTGQTMTIYFLGDSEFLDRMALETHPNTKKYHATIELS